MIIFYLIVILSAVPKHPWFGEEIGGFTIAKYLGILCVGYTLFALVRRSSSPRFLSTWPSRFFVVFCAWALLSAAFVSHSTDVFVLIQPLISYLAIFFAVVACVDSLRKLQYTTVALIGALDLASLYCLREYQKAGFGATRVGWVAGDGNFFACAALLTLPLAYQLIPTNRDMRLKWFYGGSLILTFLAFVVSGSRGALLGIMVVVLVILFTSWDRMRALLALALMALVLALSPASPVKRIFSPGYGDQVSTEDHKALWRFGVDVTLQHPLLGIGVGNFKRASAAAGITERLDGYEAHNTYIHLAAETGAPGFLLYLCVVISAFILLQQAKRRARMLKHIYLHNLASGMQLGLIGFSVAAFFVSAQTEKPFWILISLTATIPLAIRQQAARCKTQQAHVSLTVNPPEAELVPAGD